MYSISDYGWMISDRIRTNAYAAALRRLVRSDSVVLDLGTGVGIWALLACRFGARKVYAVETAPVIYLAEQLAAANGYQDRITFIRELSTRVTLPEPVDIVVAEIHGSLPQTSSSIASLIDARRFLRPDGVFIPRRETMWAAVVEAEAAYRSELDPWDQDGFDLSIAKAMILNTQRSVRVEAAALITRPHHWCTLDYSSIETPHASGEIEWRAERSGTAHGVLVWFDCDLVDGVAFSNAPGADRALFAQVLLPWPRPVAVQTGDTIAASLCATLVNNEYVWRWKSRVASSTGQGVFTFDQSTFHAEPLSRELLSREP